MERVTGYKHSGRLIRSCTYVAYTVGLVRLHVANILSLTEHDIVM